MGRTESLLKNRAYEILRERIVSGKLVPGERISERSLAAEFDMSKTPVKAALERLEEQGLVTLAPQRSAVVRAMTPKEIADHYEVRMAIEGFVARRVVGKLTPEITREFEDNLMLQRRILASPGFEGWAAADYEFHLTLVRCLGNDEITRIVTVLRDRLFQVVTHIARTDPSVPRISCAEHAEIFEHLAAGRADDAVESIVRHLENGRRFVLHGGRYGEATAGGPPHIATGRPVTGRSAVTNS